MMKQESPFQPVGRVSWQMSALPLVGRVSALRLHAPLLRSVRATMKAIHWGALKAKASCQGAKAAAAATATWHQAHCCSCTAEALLMSCISKELLCSLQCLQDRLYARCMGSMNIQIYVCLQNFKPTYRLHYMCYMLAQAPDP